MATQAIEVPHHNTEPYYSKSLQREYHLRAAPTPEKSRDCSKIAFQPNLDEYLARSAKRTLHGGLESQVPAGWPKKLSGPMIWTGSDFPDESSFVYHLSSENKNEIQNALGHFKGKQ